VARERTYAGTLLLEEKMEKKKIRGEGYSL